MAIFFTLLAWTFSLYAKTAFKISTYSYHFLFILFISGILPLVNIDIFPSIRVTTFDVNFLSNYLWPMALMLIALYPYWKAFFNNTWDDNSTLLSQSLWYTIILLTAFSSNGISVMCFYVQAVIGLYLFIAHPQKNLLEKIKYFLLSPLLMLNHYILCYCYFIRTFLWSSCNSCRWRPSL